MKILWIFEKEFNTAINIIGIILTLISLVQCGGDPSKGKVINTASTEQNANNTIIQNFYNYDIGKKIAMLEDFTEIEDEKAQKPEVKRQVVEDNFGWKYNEYSTNKNINQMFELGKSAYEARNWGMGGTAFQWLIKNNVQGAYKERTTKAWQLCSDLLEQSERFSTLIENKKIRGIVRESDVNQRAQPSILSEKKGQAEEYEDMQIIQQSSFKERIKGCNSHWYQARKNDGTVIWIFGQYWWFYQILEY